MKSFALVLLKIFFSTCVGVLIALEMTMFMTWAWSSFVEASLGAGPTKAAWFGIAVILQVLIVNATFTIPRDGATDENGGWHGFSNRVISRQLGFAVGVPCLYVTALIIGHVLGWL